MLLHIPLSAFVLFAFAFLLALFVIRKRFNATENQLRKCQQLLAHRSDSLSVIKVASASHCGVYKRIIECREMAERVRRLMPSPPCHDSYELLDKLSTMDDWLTRLALTLPQDPQTFPLKQWALTGDNTQTYLAKPHNTPHLTKKKEEEK